MKVLPYQELGTNAPSILADLKHEKLPIDTLKLPKNIPKKLADKAVRAVMRVIDRTGQQIGPVLVDDGNVIISGFEVASAMRELGATEIGVVKLSNLTPAETEAIKLLHAKVPEQSDWDDMAVANILSDISVHDPDALDLTGFDIAEIDIALGGLGEDPTLDDNGLEDEESYAALSAQRPSVVKQGDVFQAGVHRIICGNSLNADTYDSLVTGAAVALVVTDPPYNIRIAGHVSGMGKTKHEDFAMGVGEMNFDEFTQFLQAILLLCANVLRTGGLIFTFMDRRHLEELFRAIREANLRLVDVAIWNKLSGGMGGLYRGQHEPCVIAKAGKGPLTNNVQLGKFGRYRTNVWDFRGYSSFGKDRKDALAAHPTVKPWPMIAEIILDCTKRGDIVLDPFLGSGSSMLAAEKTNRRCFGIELEARYVEVAIARWEKMTSMEAVHVATGLTLKELRQIRAAGTALQIAGPEAEREANHGQL